MSTMLARHPTQHPRTIAAALALLAIFAACGPSRPATGPAGSAAAPSTTAITLSIVGTNDLHGGIVPRDGRGGLALLGGYVSNLRAARASDGAMLLIDAGDMFQGTLESNLTEGAVVVSAYNALGYAAAAVGNHEFDFGPVGASVMPRDPSDDARGALKARAADARFPLLAANLLDAATKQPVNWPNVRPSVLVDAAGLKVGIVGVMTLRALSATLSANVKDLSVAPLAPAIAAQAKALRAQGADVVIVTAHAGGRCKSFDRPTDLSSCEADSEILDVARDLPGSLVDVIVAGHSHAGMAHQAHGIAIIESFSGGRTFGRVDLTVDRASKRITRKRIFPPHDLCAEVDPATRTCDAPAPGGPARVPAEYEGHAVSPDPAVAAILGPTLDRVRDLKATPLGVVLETAIEIGTDPESPLGNLFTDVMLQAVPGAELAINNTFGGLRAPLPEGPLTYGRLFETFPFDNMIVSFGLTGGAVKRMFVDRLQQDRNLPGIAGLQVRATCAEGAIRVDLHRRDGRQVADNDQLSVVTTDFLATGGDGIFATVTPPQGLTVEETGLMVRDVAADWFRRRGGRMREVDLVDRKNPRWQVPGQVPLKCQ
jgi:5'-nucleotidase